MVRLGHCGVSGCYSRLVFGRLEVVDKLQADGGCRLRRLVFLFRPSRQSGWSRRRRVQAFGRACRVSQSVGWKLAGAQHQHDGALGGTAEASTTSSTSTLSTAPTNNNIVCTHQSGLLTLACAAFSLGRCAVGRLAFAVAVAVHDDFGLAVVA